MLQLVHLVAVIGTTKLAPYNLVKELQLRRCVRQYLSTNHSSNGQQWTLGGCKSVAMSPTPRMTCKHYPHYWPFVRGIHQSLVDSTHKAASNAELWWFWFGLHLFNDDTRPQRHISRLDDSDLLLAKQAVELTSCQWLKMPLTHWGRDKIDGILQTTFSNAIS